MRQFATWTGAAGTAPTLLAYYVYNASGQRTKKITQTGPATWQVSVYVGAGFEHRYEVSAGTPTEEQTVVAVLDGQSRLYQRRAGDTLGDQRPAELYTLEDHLGSATATVDAGGAVVSREEYYPFGETSFGSHAKQRYRFCGKERDQESGLYYYGMRYYAPWLCRFVSVDPLAEKYAFYTPYQYAGNQPINFIDLDGAEPAKPMKDISTPINQKTFIANFKLWEPVVEQYRRSIPYMPIKENKSNTELRILIGEKDFTNRTQLIDTVPGLGTPGHFSYNQYFGSHVNVGGFPLDVKHFLSNAYYSPKYGSSWLKVVGEYEERWQAINPEASPGGRSSAYSPEDLLTNRLGQIYGGFLPSGNENLTSTLDGFLNEVSELFQTNAVVNGKFLGDSQISDLREILSLYGSDDFRDFQKGGAAWQPDRRNNLVSKEQSESSTSAMTWTHGYVHDIVPNWWTNKAKPAINQLIEKAGKAVSK